jgi:hypothetical protein
MGYRSEVAYVINFMDEDKRKEFIALMKVRGDELWTAVKECSLDRFFPCINFHASDVKWYDSYPDVRMHHNLLDWVAEHYSDYAGYKFMRVGEEMGDTDDRFGGNDEFYPEEDFYFTQGMELPFQLGTYEPIGESIEEEHA